MFRAATLVILNKVELLPYLDFSVERCDRHCSAFPSRRDDAESSARTGEGIGVWYDWIRSQALAARQFGFV
jgi:hydrogenase nickel incorporation protein HypB